MSERSKRSFDEQPPRRPEEPKSPKSPKKSKKLGRLAAGASALTLAAAPLATAVNSDKIVTIPVVENSGTNPAASPNVGTMPKGGVVGSSIRYEPIFISNSVVGKKPGQIIDQKSYDRTILAAIRRAKSEEIRGATVSVSVTPRILGSNNAVKRDGAIGNNTMTQQIADDISEQAALRNTHPSVTDETLVRKIPFTQDPRFNRAVKVAVHFANQEAIKASDRTTPRVVFGLLQQPNPATKLARVGNGELSGIPAAADNNFSGFDITIMATTPGETPGTIPPAPAQ